MRNEASKGGVKYGSGEGKKTSEELKEGGRGDGVNVLASKFSKSPQF